MPLKAISRRILASGVLSLPIIGGTMAKNDRKFFEYAETVLGERIAAEEKGCEARNDIMQHLLRAKDPMTGARFSREQLNVESSLLIAAGADTTSVTLAAAFFYLLHNPRVMHTVMDEVLSAYPNERDEMIPSKLIGLPYLRAVIDETLRLSPPVPSLLPREVLKGGIIIDGNYIPEGIIVGVPAYAIHRNPEYFPEPDIFYPERWLAHDSNDSSDSSPPNIPRTQDAISLARRAFISFSQGSRGCIGRQLAYYELHTALTIILHRFDIRLAQDPLTQRTMDDSTSWRESFPDDLSAKRVEADKASGWRREEEFQLFDRFLSDRNGPMVEFREIRQ
jgi:cytochrome P450